MLTLYIGKMKILWSWAHNMKKKKNEMKGVTKLKNAFYNRFICLTNCEEIGNIKVGVVMCCLKVV